MLGYVQMSVITKTRKESVANILVDINSKIEFSWVFNESHDYVRMLLEK